MNIHKRWFTNFNPKKTLFTGVEFVPDVSGLNYQLFAFVSVDDNRQGDIAERK